MCLYKFAVFSLLYFAKMIRKLLVTLLLCTLVSSETPNVGKKNVYKKVMHKFNISYWIR